ncbi:MAG: xylulokinase, partial [Vicinamibacterales bacterium]
MALYLGFDCSTQSFGAIVIDIDGDVRRVVFQHSLNFDREFPAYNTRAGVLRGRAAGEVFAPPVMWAAALDRMMATIAEAPELDVSWIRAISGSAQQHGSVYVNDSAVSVWQGLHAHTALAPQISGTFARAGAPVWMDESTTSECREIEHALGGDEATARLTGSRAFERFTGPQIRKFFLRQPAAYAKTARIHLVSSFLASLLAGDDAPIDLGDGSGMNLMDLVSGEWSGDALAATADDLQRRLPALRPSSTVVGTLAPYWQARHGFPAATVIAWSGDNPCSLIGTGTVLEGQLAISLGTSDTVFTCTREPHFGASHVFRSPTGDYMNLVCFRNGSLARERVRDDYGLDWEGFSRALESRPPGNNGALMLPWFESEITPHVAAGGARRFDLDEHDAAANVRAVVEAQMMAMANHSTEMMGQPVVRIVATGGASTNRAILQVMADVFGCEVSPLKTPNTACLGAALRAYHADRLAEGEPVNWDEV